MLKLREDIGRIVSAELVLDFSRTLTPAVELLRDKLATGDCVAASAAMDVLRTRCSQAGLITDMNLLF